MLDWEQEAEILVSRFGTVRIKAAIESMSEAYRLGKGTKGPRLDGEILVAAYLAVRFPATLAANRAVLRAVNDSLRTRGVDPEFAPESLLDLGAGCGAAIIAAQEAWGALREVTAIEQINRWSGLLLSPRTRAMMRAGASFPRVRVRIAPLRVIWKARAMGCM